MITGRSSCKNRTLKFSFLALQCVQKEMVFDVKMKVSVCVMGRGVEFLNALLYIFFYCLLCIIQTRSLSVRSNSCLACLQAVANSTSATFLRVVGSELIQKYLGDGPKLVRELFRVADDLSPSIVFIDEIDAVGTKR